MDSDGDDLLLLAIDSVANEISNDSRDQACNKLIINKKLKKTKDLAKPNVKPKEDFSCEYTDDILALAFEDAEKEAVSIPVPNEKKTLVDVDLRFDIDSGEQPEVSDRIEQKLKKDTVSEIHTGETDSSDDEDNKYFEESRYNTYGKTIKQALQLNVKTDHVLHQVNSLLKGRPCLSNPSSASPKQSLSKEKIDVTADPIFGIRMVNPLVSSYAIREMMQGRLPVGCFKIKNHVKHGDLKTDWVFGSVLVRKFPPRVSQNGNNYSQWVLSDLKNDLKSVLLFLFGRAHEELWKTPVGVVLAILNPSVLGDDKKSEYEAKLSIKTSDQIMIWGKSKDLGQCKSKKKSGEVCGSFVNIAQCEFCVFHVKQEYKKYNSRPDFGNNGKINLRNKVLGKNEVFYGGKSFSSMPVVGKKVSNPKDAVRLQGLGPSSVPLKPAEVNVQIPNLPRSNEILKLLPQGTITNNKLKDQSRLNQLSSNAEKKSLSDSNLSRKKENITKLNKPILPVVETKKPSLSNPGDLCFDNNLSTNNRTLNTTKLDKKNVNPTRNKLQKRFNDLTAMSSVIGQNSKRTFQCSKPAQKCDQTYSDLSTCNERKLPDKADCSSSTNNNVKPLIESSEAKQITHMNFGSPELGVTTPKHKMNLSPVEMKKVANSNSESPKSTGITIQHNRQSPSLTHPNAQHPTSRAKLKALAFIKNKGPILKNNPTGTDPDKKSLKRPHSPSDEDQMENKKPVLSERFLQLMNQKSIHEDLVQLREMEQEADYFEKLEKKDQMEEKMLNTFKIECKAVVCTKCNYTWFSASDACKAEGHPIKVIDTVKRFFKCGKCSNRTVSLTIIPLIPCKKCFSSNWIRAPMIREKLASGNSLSIRGGEQKHLNSVTTNGSLNLLVPD